MQLQVADSESAALAAVYRLLRELGKRRLASQGDENGAPHPDHGNMTTAGDTPHPGGSRRRSASDAGR